MLTAKRISNGKSEEKLPNDIVCRLSANYRPIIGRLSADCRPTVGLLSFNCRPFVGNVSVTCWPTGYRQLKMGAIVHYYQDINQAITCTNVVSSWYINLNLSLPDLLVTVCL